MIVIKDKLLASYPQYLNHILDPQQHKQSTHHHKQTTMSLAMPQIPYRYLTDKVNNEINKGIVLSATIGICITCIKLHHGNKLRKK